MQALCFFAGANSIFYGEKLLTTPNPEANKDLDLFERLGIHPESAVLEHEEQGGQDALVANAFNGRFSHSTNSRQALFYDAAAN